MRHRKLAPCAADRSRAGPLAQIGETPLHSAAYFGRPAVVTLLLDRGSNIEAKNNVRAVLFRWPCVTSRHTHPCDACTPARAVRRDAAAVCLLGGAGCVRGAAGAARRQPERQEHGACVRCVITHARSDRCSDVLRCSSASAWQDAHGHVGGVGGRRDASRAENQARLAVEACQTALCAHLVAYIAAHSDEAVLLICRRL